MPSASTADAGRGRRIRWARRIRDLGGAALLLVLLVGFVLVTAGPRVLPYQVRYVRTGSMAPAVPVGALAVYVPTRAADLVPGDVIAFVPPGRSTEVVAHRIVDVETTPDGRAFVTRGDANARPDTWRVPARGTGWRQTLALPYLGYALAALVRPVVRLGLLGALTVAVAAALLVRLWRPGRRPVPDRPGAPGTHG